MEILEKVDMETTENIQDEECDVENMWDIIIEGVKEAVEAKKNGVELQDAEEFLNSL